jgi:hypothetical protein
MFKHLIIPELIILVLPDKGAHYSDISRFLSFPLQPPVLIKEPKVTYPNTSFSIRLRKFTTTGQQQIICPH